MNRVDETFQREINAAGHADEHFVRTCESLKMNIKMESHQTSTTDCSKQFLNKYASYTKETSHLTCESKPLKDNA